MPIKTLGIGEGLYTREGVLVGVRDKVAVKYTCVSTVYVFVRVGKGEVVGALVSGKGGAGEGGTKNVNETAKIKTIIAAIPSRFVL